MDSNLLGEWWLRGQGNLTPHVRGEDFLTTDPIMIFGLHAIERLDPEYDHAGDYIAHLSSVHAVPTRSYFFYLTKIPPTLPQIPIPYAKTYLHQS